MVLDCSKNFGPKMDDPHTCSNKDSTYFNQSVFRHDTCGKFTKKVYHNDLVPKRCENCIHYKNLVKY